MNAELTRLQAAIAAIHSHLHAGEIDAAHRACECAMAGEAVTQPNLTLSDSARIQQFAAKFNELCEQLGINAGFVARLPSATRPGHTSVQIGGEVETCRLVEKLFQQPPSFFQGDHGR